MAIVAIGPDQDHDVGLGESEAHQALFAVGGAIVLVGELGAVVPRRAVRQVDSMLTQTCPALGGMMTRSASAYMR
jgi:hypothetical protein